MERIRKRIGTTDVLRRRNIEHSPTFGELRSAFEKYLRDEHKKQQESSEEVQTRQIEEVADAVILDFDGVLFASLDAMAIAGVRTIEKLSGHVVTQEEFLAKLDAPYIPLYERFGVTFEHEESIQNFYQDYQTEYQRVVEELGGIDLYDEAPEVIHTLKEKGLAVFILSAKDPKELEELLHSHGIHDTIDGFIGGKEQKSESIKHLVEKGTFAPERVIMFGDLPSDIRDAQAAGIRSAGVARFAGNEDRLSAYDPDYLVTSMVEVIHGLTPHDDHNRKK